MIVFGCRGGGGGRRGFVASGAITSRAVISVDSRVFFNDLVGD